MTDHSKGDGEPDGPLTDPAPPPTPDDDDFEQLAAAVAEVVGSVAGVPPVVPIDPVTGARMAATEPAPPESDESPDTTMPAMDPISQPRAVAVEPDAPSEPANAVPESQPQAEPVQPSQPAAEEPSAPKSQPRMTPVDHDAVVAKLKDQLLRSAADFDNFRKRTKRDLVDAERRGREDTIRDLLPIFDNLERAVAASEAAADTEAIAQGVRMVLKQFEDVGSRIGIERIQCIGAHFDPSLHDAVQQMETNEQPPGTIVKEVVPGYRLGERLIRPAMVVVARPAEAKPEPAEDEPSAEADKQGESSAPENADPEESDDATPGDET